MKIRNLLCFHEYITLINGSIKFQISDHLEKVQIQIDYSQCILPSDNFMKLDS